MGSVTWDRSRILTVYRSMLAIRLAEESFVPVILDGTVRCPVHLYSGEEAIATGICEALEQTDYVMGSHRSHGHFLAKGGTIEALVAEVYCREGGCAKGRGGSMHLIDVEKGMLGAAPIVAGTISLAMGAALAAQIRGDRRVSVAFFGDGATGEGVLAESMNFAAVKKLPIIFVCENNLYSTHMPIAEIRVPTPISALAAPYGMRSVTLDGNDVVLIHETAVELVEACRRGEGPVFMELLTYRMRGHVGPNDNIQGTLTDIRPAAEIEHWRARDPIAQFEAFALATKLVTAADFSAVTKSVDEEVAEAHRFAAASPRPLENELERYVFHV
jgi:TPP-dependent pyruvate/acetoin dehydrogenase alpha subunit